ncbi:hypothetical protein TNCV_2827001 [Trichonephila clavipes]|nr:hypothetical protein TNCV_2827001 [Trichonephila clavipes]
MDLVILNLGQARNTLKDTSDLAADRGIYSANDYIFPARRDIGTLPSFAEGLGLTDPFLAILDYLTNSACVFTSGEVKSTFIKSLEDSVTRIDSVILVT